MEWVIILLLSLMALVVLIFQNLTAKGEKKPSENVKSGQTVSHKTMMSSKDVAWDVLPDEFVIFDFETTGLKHHNPVDIIEISAIKVIKETFRQSGKVEAHTAIVKPWRGGLNTEAMAVNKISQQLIDDEGKDSSLAIHEFVDFVGDRLLVSYNVSFDRWFLQRELIDQGISKKYKYECALQLARKAFPNLENYRLTTVASRLGLNTSGAHRALQDCVLALQVYVWSKTKIEAIKAEESDPHANRYKFSSHEELYGKSVVFTGTLELSSRDEAEKLATLSGMIVRKSLSKKTDFFVAGKKPGKKLEQALALKKTPLTEIEFWKMVQPQIIDTLEKEKD